MKRAVVPFAGLIACLMLAACGIGPTRVTVDKPAKTSEPGGADSGQAPLDRSKLSIATAKELVEHFLRAPATDKPKRREHMQGYYLSPAIGPEANAPVNVIRLPEGGIPALPVSEPGNRESLTIRVQHLGVLQDDGRIVPTGRGEENYKFVVVPGTNGKVFSEVPGDLLLIETALTDYFEVKPLYFWSTDNQRMVQDLRYVPRSLTPVQQKARLVNLLYAGPASWLAGSVNPLPAATRPRGDVVLDGSTLTIDLATLTSEAELKLLGQQLAQTLLGPGQPGLRITVQQQLAPPEVPWIAAKTFGPPSRYGVVNGVAYRLEPATSARPKFLNQRPELNKNVQAVAVSHQEGAIALVRSEGSAQRLTVISAAWPSGFTFEGLPTRPMAQPIWLDQGQTLLVHSGDELYQLDIGTGKHKRVAQIKGLSQISVAPDGRRLAVVIDGALYLASRDSQGQIALDGKQSVPTGFTTVQSAAFHLADNPYRLIVAGVDARGVSIAAMNFDGTDRKPYEKQFSSGSVIQHLVGRAGQAMYELEGVGSYQAQQVGAGDLAGEVQWGDTAKPASVVVRAPSFEGEGDACVGCGSR